jgi:hypothetical protein
MENLELCSFCVIHAINHLVFLYDVKMGDENVYNEEKAAVKVR